MAVLIADMVSQRLDRSFRGGIAEVQGAIYRGMVGPGALLSVLSGLMLTFKMYGQFSTSVGAWLGTMQGVGVLATLITLLGAMPAATRLSRLEPVGESAQLFDATATRLRIAGGIGTFLACVALLAGALYRG
jgi:hypothetical protein